MSSVLGPIRLSAVEQIVLAGVYIPWARTNAKSSKNAITYYYEKNLHKSINDVRNELNIKAAPEWRY